VATHNIKQLGFSGLLGFGSRASVFLGGQERSPKTQSFQIANRWRQFKKEHNLNEHGNQNQD